MSNKRENKITDLIFFSSFNDVSLFVFIVRGGEGRGRGKAVVWDVGSD